MSGVEQWWSGGLDGAAAHSLPVWAAGALAALLFFLGVLAFTRSAQVGRGSAAWRAALVVVGAGLTWVLIDNLGGRDLTAERRLLEARSAELTLRAIAPGSPLACLETVANVTVEEACEKALFASAETVASAVAYVDARLTLLAGGLELPAKQRGDGAAIERLRRAMEADRFGLVAQVLATRGCSADACPAFKLLRDPSRVAANLRDRHFDANVVLHASAWRNEPGAPAIAAAPTVPSAPTLAAMPPAPTTTGSAVPPGGKFDFPSASSIPAISIMNAEPPLSPEESAGEPPARAAAPAAKPPATARRHPPREQPSREQPQTAQAPPSVPMPLSPPGTIANPR